MHRNPTILCVGTTPKVSERLKLIGKFLAFLIALFGAGFGVYEYFDGLEQEKIEQSLKYHRLYSTSDGIKQTRYDFQKVFEKLFHKYKENGPDEFKRQMIETIAAPQNRLNYDEVLKFFDNVYKCSTVEGGCDRETMFNLFADEALRIQTSIYPVIIHYRKHNPEHGLGLECIATEGTSKKCEK